MIGKVEEVGKKHTKFDELFGVDVTSFDGNVTYVQRVKIKKPIIKNFNKLTIFVFSN